jgi:hypothetical protein
MNAQLSIGSISRGDRPDDCTAHSGTYLGEAGLIRGADPTTSARESFGAVELGDPRRTARLVKMGALVAASPAGTVTRKRGHGALHQGSLHAPSFERSRSRCEARLVKIGALVAARPQVL